MAKKQVEGIIYCYTNKINNKKYIGQTTDENSRKIKFRTQDEYCTSHKNGGRLSHFDNARKKNTALIPLFMKYWNELYPKILNLFI